ncbi:BCCT family transporter [Cellulomonas denverensis]|uniref:BCCT family transporter n=1 Tax=Cellulomonas denverensis TaxID=264297 RepID=A0A7X6QYP0_9CELL|nr:BCCT family transporter [Cellulomonas denverensis]NKY22313.1 BCCT family transporter [Cellulomonas denverensis]GIG25858.1 choline transporter [Cellulomonas denverensis]
MPSSRPFPAGRWGIAPAVFWPSAAIVAVVAGLTIAFPGPAERFIGAVQSNVVSGFGWYYVLLVAGFVAFSLWVGIGRWGDITLGQDDDEPRYKLGTWFSMLFAAGMGIGLVFWGVAEPLSHYADPKPGVEGSPAQLAQAAMSQTYLHWGVHAWAIYVVVGLGLAYTIHRKGRPVSIRWALEPLLGDRVRGRLGDVVDVTAVVGTVFGVATSLGLGVMQIAAGLEHAGVVESASTGLEIVLIIVVTAAATLSVVSGLDKGLKWLSNINVSLAGVLMLLVMVLGPTLFLLREFVQSLGNYLSSFLSLTFNVSAYTGAEGEAWQAAWTTFYWGWWISWAPFVGVFIARISRGRTVREFVGGVLLVPTLVTFLWFSVLGGSALFQELFGGGGLIGPDGEVVPENALFDLLAGLPGGAALTIGAIILIALFFVTSADSGALVVAMLSAGGNPNPGTRLGVVWAALVGVLAIALMLAGGLTALQTAAILIALPFSVVMIGMVFATSKALHLEHMAVLRAERRRARATLTAHVTATVEAQLAERGEGPATPDPDDGGARWWRKVRGPRD